jgi:uncharacterized protein YbjT (DUF2867 family)
MSTNKILIIGGHGMLGRPVVRRLLKDGFSVSVMARSAAKAKAVLPKETAVLAGDLESVSSLDQALQGQQAVYLSVDTTAKMKFKPETEGLANLIAALKNHPSTRLIVLSAYGQSFPDAANYPWWHVRLKYEAQMMTERSGLAWTLLEPTWFLESLPLFVKGRSFTSIKGSQMRPYWIAGDDMGRILSKALLKNLGVGERIPVQGTESMTLLEAGQRFAAATDPTISVKEIPLWLIRAIGVVSSQAKDFAALIKVSNEIPEPAPDPLVWGKYEKPLMTVEDYAAYVKQTGDFPQK